MLCKLCTTAVWKDKLGKCIQCVISCGFLFIFSGLGYLFLGDSAYTAVQSVALLLVIICSGFLLLLHLIAFVYYRFQAVSDNTKVDK